VRKQRRYQALPFLTLLAVALVTACAITPTAKKIRKAEAGNRGFTQDGLASWYGPGFQGNLTANGEIYDMNAMTAAHKQLPFNTVVVVTNRDNGRRVEVRINDRGPFVRGRIIDLSRAAAERIGMLGPGTARVTLRVVEHSSKQARRYGAPSPDAKGSLTSTGFRVQIGAFRDGRRAEKLWEDARRVRSDVRVRLSAGLFLVESGPFKSRDAAKRAERAFVRAGFEAAVLQAL